MFLYTDGSGGFIGCPSDVEKYSSLLERWCGELVVPGARPSLYHYKKSYDPGATKGPEGDQFRIRRTSDRRTSPVLILFGNMIGTPVRPPPEGWGELRAWLDGNGWSMVCLLGHGDYLEADEVPDGKIPLSGTMYELFDAMRALEGDETILHVFDLHLLEDVSPGIDVAPEVARRQAEWCRLLMAELGKSRFVSTPGSKPEFEAQAKKMLARAFGAATLDPCTDQLPGLDALDEGSPLLFGRDDFILGGQGQPGLSGRVFDEGARVTSVLGVSGAGKSSLLRAGLMSHWFSKSPQGPGTFVGATGLLVEPDLLQPEEAAAFDDPLVALGGLLTSQNRAESLNRAVGPFPGPIGADLPALAPATGDQQADLLIALDWWSVLSAELPKGAPLVLIIDQAEQIEARARRQAEDDAARRGEDVGEILLSAGWWRFTALLGALVGRLSEEHLSPAVQERLAGPDFQKSDLRLLLGLHRASATDIWPWTPRLPGEVVTVEPLQGEEILGAVIRGSFRAYGLRLEPVLLESMSLEASALASQTQDMSIPGSDPKAQVPTTHAAASVLPQLVTAMQRMMTLWRDRHPKAQDLQPSDMVLTEAEYGEKARIEGSINELGEEAWQVWQGTIAEDTGVNTQSLFARRALEEEQTRNFAQLMMRLVDVRDRKRQDLTHILLDGPVARQRERLVTALRDRRLLTSVTLGKGAGEARYLRLPHRSILDYWGRAQGWMAEVEPLLEAKARYKAHAEFDEGPQDWKAENVDRFIGLALQWIGPQEGEDAALLARLKAEIITNFEPAQADLRGETLAARLPYQVFSNADQGFRDAIWAKLTESPAFAAQAGPAMIAAAESGDLALLQQVFAAVNAVGLDTEALANFTDVETGLFPLLQASQNGHAEVVAALLAKGAEPNTVHESNGTFPLLQASQQGHAEVVAALLAKGAEPNLVNEKSGLFPLLQASQNGHAEVIAALLAKGAEPNIVNEKSGSFPLLMASQNGHAEVVAALLAKGAEPNTVNETNGSFPLLMASQQGHAEVVAALLAKGAEPNTVNESSGIFPLLQASQEGHAEVVAALLAKGVGPNIVNETNGSFPLLQASQQGHAEVVAALLAKGAEPNTVNETNGTFPLLQASRNGHAEVVASLLAKGAEPNTVHEKSGSFPLLMASQNGHAEVVAMLLAKGAEPNTVDPIDGGFPLLAASQQGHAEVVAALLAKGVGPNTVHEKSGSFPLLMASQNGHAEVVAALLAKGAEPNTVHEKSGSFPLLMASQNGHAEVVAALLAKGAEPNTVNETNGTFPLLMASQQGHAEVVASLLAKGAEPNTVDPIDGGFPLLMASQNGHAEVVAALLAKGAEPNTVNETNGSFPLLQASQQGHAEVVAALLAKGAEPNTANEKSGSFPLLIASQKGHAEVVASLLTKGAEPNTVDPIDGGFPLLMASQSGYVEVVASLLAKGAEPNTVHEKSGSFPLLMASQNGHAEVVASLLAKGAEPNTVHEKSGSFPLLMASQNGHAEVVASLLAKGAEPNTANEKSGSFPLLIASQKGHAEVVASLLAKGAEPNTVDPIDGGFPLLMASQNGHVEVVASLLAKGAEPNTLNETNGTFPLLMASQDGHAEVVASLLAKGAEIDAKHSGTGGTSLIYALANQRWEVARLLLDHGASTDLVPEQLRPLLDALMSHVEMPEPEAPQSGEKETAQSLPPPPIPGDWQSEEVTDEVAAEVDAALREAGIPPAVFAGIVSRERFEDALGPELHLRRQIFGVKQPNGTLALSLMWLSIGNGKGPVLLYPGLELSGLAVGLGELGSPLDLRQDKHRKTFAALVAVLNGQPLYPLPQEGELPFLGDADALRSATPAETWRSWRNYRGPLGPVVELPVMVEGAVVRITVAVPDDGNEARILKGDTIIDSTRGWNIPQWTQDEKGNVGKMMILGMMGDG